MEDVGKAGFPDFSFFPGFPFFPDFPFFPGFPNFNNKFVRILSFFYPNVCDSENFMYICVIKKRYYVM
jgi:hypothetical protein